jgi:hypothetical protein
MNGPMTPDRARELLETQLEELGTLRNAHARDPRFKQWRQATLTIIQRIWPGDTVRAERFRRIPFSPPSSKMSLKVTRSFFEKGCAEAVQFIRSMFPELKGAVGKSQRAERSSAPAPGEVEDDFPIVDLPGESGPRNRRDDDDDEPDRDEGLAIPPAPTPRAKPDPKRPEPPIRVLMKSGLRISEPIPPPREKPTPKPADPRPPLREMLGFSSDPLDDDEEMLELPDNDDPPLYDEEIEAKAAENEWELEEATEAESGDEDDAPFSWEAPEEFQLPARKRGPGAERDDDTADPIIETDPENFPPAEAAADETPEPVEEPTDDTGEMEEFLRTSPVLKASARPVRRRGSNLPTTPSPLAASLVALASEVAQLGVPEGQRAGMRATLIELARRLDERSLDWDTLRDSFHAVLDFPPLARRVIPLLIPYLDLAA